MNEQHLHIDFESRSDVDLKKCGSDVYSRDPSTEVLMMSYGFNDEPVRIWYPHQGPMPERVRQALDDPKVIKIAHNAAFELAIFHNTLKIHTPVEQWRCTMVMAYSLGLPGSLESLARDALKLPSKYHKDPEGHSLMQKFSYPRAKWTWQTHPTEFARYGDYCIQDTVVEKKIYQILFGYTKHFMDRMFREWHLDQKINARGLPVDMDFIDAAEELAKRAKDEFKAALQKKTGLVNPNSTQQLLPWLQERGYPFSSLGKNRIQISLDDHSDDMTDEAKDVMRLRLMSNKTSTTKYAALRRASHGGRLRNTYQYLGAAATGRYAGRILGQNMPRPWKSVEDFLEDVRDMIAARDYEALEFFFDQPLECVVSSIRSAIKAPRGKMLAVADLASIELVVIAWLTGCKFWLDVLRQGKDAYKAFAEKWLGVPYEKVEKWMRTLAKPPALGCFAADTKVMTKNGWVSIVNLTASDHVFDGVEFVKHDGVAFMGVKNVIDMCGVSVTPDHLILCGESRWIQAKYVAQEDMLSAQAIEWANGLCSRSKELQTRAGPQAGTTVVSAGAAETSRLSTGGTLNGAKPAPATSVQAPSLTLQVELCTAALAFPLNTSTVCPTDSMPCVAAVSGGQNLTPNTPVEALSVDSLAPRISSDTQSRCQGGTINGCTSTEKTTTGTMSRGTCGSSLAPRINATNGLTSSSSTEASDMCLKTSIDYSVLDTETLRPSLENFAPGSTHNGSSTDKTAVGVPTFDVVNAGPRNRYVIQTPHGPMIVHNCGYRMGAGRRVLNPKTKDWEKTGLWGYAANMSVEMTKEQCKDAVRIYRDLSPEIKQAWKDLEEAAMDCVREKTRVRCGLITFDYTVPFLRMHLPSGRIIHYCRPRIEKVRMEYEDSKTGELKVEWKIGLTYERLSQTSNKWVRRSNHGGRYIEQAVQGIARDILQLGIENAEAAGMPVIGHYHDEILTEVDDDDDQAHEDLIEEMTRKAPWMTDMMVRAEGYTKPFYRK